jgi:kinesin family protein C1
LALIVRVLFECFALYGCIFLLLDFQSKSTVDEVPLAKKRKIGSIKMPQANLSSRTANRLPLAERNGGGDLPITNGLPSNAGSDCGGDIEFTKESIEALLNERSKVKNKYNYKEKCDQMIDYIKRLKDCIRWFQQLRKLCCRE